MSYRTDLLWPTVLGVCLMFGSYHVLTVICTQVMGLLLDIGKSTSFGIAAVLFNVPRARNAQHHVPMFMGFALLAGLLHFGLHRIVG